MHIQIAVTTRLNLFCGHEKLLIQFFIKLVKDQASLRGYKSTVRISVLLIPDVHDRLTLLINIIHHPHKILLIIAVIPITLGNDRFNILQCALHNIMHDLNRNLLLTQFIHLINHGLTYMSLLFIRKLRQCTICAFAYRVNNLLNIKIFQTAVLFDYLYDSVRFEFQTEILVSYLI